MYGKICSSVAYTTAKKYKAVLSKVFCMAVRRGIIDSNPCTTAALPVRNNKIPKINSYSP